MNDWLLRDRTPARQAFVPTTLNLPLNLMWSTPLGGAVLAPPVCVQGGVYVCSLSSLSMLEAATGQLAWRFPVKELPAPQVNAFKSSPAIAANRIYVTDMAGVLYCLERQSGRLLWENAELLAANESPCISHDRLFTRVGGTKMGSPGYACLDLDGRLIWFHSTQGPIRTTASALKSGRLVFGDAAGFVYALEEQTGRELWRLNVQPLASLIPVPVPPKAVSPVGTPVIAENTVLLRVGDTRNFCGIDLTSGVLKWQHVADADLGYRGSADCAVADESRMYYTIRDLFRVIDIETGQVVRTVENPRYRFGDSMSLSGLVVNGHYFASFNMSKQLVAFNTETGEVEWAFVGESGYSAPGIYCDEKLLIGSDGGEFYCFS